MSRRGRLWLVAAMLLLLWALLSAASYFLLVVPRQNRFDFYHCWTKLKCGIIIVDRLKKAIKKIDERKIDLLRYRGHRQLYS